MASKKDKANLAAQKARKQKIVAIIGGVLLLGLVAIQGPKLLKQVNPPAPKSSSEAVAPVGTSPATAGTTAPIATQATAAASAAGPTAVLAGVRISSAPARPGAQDGKLVSFTLFESKDPFVQQEATGTSPATTPTDAASGASSSSTSPPAATDSTAPATTVAAPKPTNATIEVNGKASQVELKAKFPQPGPTFVLIALTGASAKIGVAGGTFESGKPLTLKMGKQVILVDAATGVRYALKLVYAGAEPEQTQTFSSGATQPTQTKP